MSSEGQPGPFPCPPRPPLPHLLEKEATPSLAYLRQHNCPGVALPRADPSLALIRHSVTTQSGIWHREFSMPAAQSGSGKSFEEGSNFHPRTPSLFLSFLSAWLQKKLNTDGFVLEN